jgi:excisionase family DNA binding protein
METKIIETRQDVINLTGIEMPVSGQKRCNSFIMNDASLPFFSFNVTPEFTEYLIRLIKREIAEQSNPTPEPVKYLTKKQVCDLMFISYPTLDRYVKIKILQRYKIGSRVLFLESEVQQAIRNLPVKFIARLNS